MGGLVNEYRQLAGRGLVHLSSIVEDGTIDEIVDQGIRALTMFHIPATVEFVPSGVRVNRLDLLYFYGNRSRTFDQVDPQRVIADAQV